MADIEQYDVHDIGRTVNSLLVELCDKKKSPEQEETWQNAASATEAVLDEDDNLLVDYRKAYTVLFDVRSQLQSLLADMTPAPEADEDLDESVEEALQQTVITMTHELHSILSESNQWFKAVQWMQTIAPTFSSLKFFRYLLSYVLQEIMRNDMQLKNPKKLLAYIQSNKGRKRIQWDIFTLLRRDDAGSFPVELFSQILNASGIER